MEFWEGTGIDAGCVLRQDDEPILGVACDYAYISGPSGHYNSTNRWGRKHPHKGYHGHRRKHHAHRRKGLKHPHKGYHGHRHRHKLSLSIPGVTSSSGGNTGGTLKRPTPLLGHNKTVNRSLTTRIS